VHVIRAQLGCVWCHDKTGIYVGAIGSDGKKRVVKGHLQDQWLEKEKSLNVTGMGQESDVDETRR
jgi:hypothetical protein